MKKVIIPLLLVIVFICGFSVVSAASSIEIVCSSNTCSTTEFELIQLTSTNTGSSGNYKDYSSYMKSYYMSGNAYTSDYLSFYNKPYVWTSTWSSTNGFATNKNVFDTLVYPYVGTYVFLLRQTDGSFNTYRDATEYIVYVSVKSDITVGTIRAEKIKNSYGTAITASKVTQISFQQMKPFHNDYYESDEVFRLTNNYTGDYADKSKTVSYFVKLTGGTGNVIGYIYDDNGCVMSGSYCKTINFTYGTNTSVTLADGQALVFRANQLAIGTNIQTSVYHGLESYGYTLTTAAYSNGNPATIGSGIAYFTLGNTGQSYVDYVWDYADSNVPEAGVTINIVPYVVMVAFSLLVCAFLVTSRRKRAKEFYF